jgi:hypothetical protein
MEMEEGVGEREEAGVDMEVPEGDGRKSALYMRG